MRKKGAAKNETKRAKRIAALKRQAKELAGGKMLVGELEGMLPRSHGAILGAGGRL